MLKRENCAVRRYSESWPCVVLLNGMAAKFVAILFWVLVVRKISSTSTNPPSLISAEPILKDSGDSPFCPSAWVKGWTTPVPCTPLSTGSRLEETVAGADTSTSLAGCSFLANAVCSALDCDFSASISCCCAAICFCVCDSASVRVCCCEAICFCVWDRASRTGFTSAATSESFVEESPFWGLDCAHRNPGTISTKHRARSTLIVDTPSFPPLHLALKKPAGWMNTLIPNASRCGLDRSLFPLDAEAIRR